MIKVLVSGAAGKMGTEVIRALKKETDMKLVGAVDIAQIGIDAGEDAGVGPAGVEISKNLKAAINDSRPDVVIDFTHPNVAMMNIRVILNSKVHAVIGTTGLTDENLGEIKKLCLKNKVNCIVAPNFAIGAVLMMMFSKTAAKYMPNVEIIELHHDKKADAPSGTSIKTAEMIDAARKQAGAKAAVPAGSPDDPARGEEKCGIRVHSVRLPGLVAHQEVIFGGTGQVLTIRHDSLDRTSFMPGVLLAVRRATDIRGVIHGLDKLL
jgi:4-hydroxy-tetrahydrodipicolinate reductase